MRIRPGTAAGAWGPGAIPGSINAIPPGTNLTVADASHSHTTENVVLVPWAPTSLSGLHLWLDASDTATISHISNGVTQWNDKSGNGRNVTPPLASYRPVTNTRTMNGRNVIDFISDDLLNTANHTLNQPITVFVVAQYDNISTAQRKMFGGIAGSTPTIMTNVGTWRYAVTSEIDSTVTDDAAAHVFTAVFNGASSGLYLDGALIASGNPGTGGWAATHIDVGSGNGTQGWDGTVGEVLVYNSALNGTDRALAEGYLRGKWGTP